MDLNYSDSMNPIVCELQTSNEANYSMHSLLPESILHNRHSAYELHTRNGTSH